MAYHSRQPRLPKSRHPPSLQRVRGACGCHPGCPQIHTGRMTLADDVNIEEFVMAKVGAAHVFCHCLDVFSDHPVAAALPVPQQPSSHVHGAAGWPAPERYTRSTPHAP